MSEIKNNALQINESEKSHEVQSTSLSFGFNEHSASYSSSNNNNYVLTTQPNLDNAEMYSSCAFDGSQQRTNSTTGPSDEQSVLLTTRSINDEDWKCRECGYINSKSDNVCDTCGTSKPFHPLVQVLPYTETPSSIFSSGRDSPSSGIETMYNRSGSESPPRCRRKSSYSYSSDENTHQSSKYTTKSRSSSKSSSKERSSSPESTCSYRDDNNRSRQVHSQIYSPLPKTDCFSRNVAFESEASHRQTNSITAKSLINPSEPPLISIKDKDDLSDTQSQLEIGLNFPNDGKQNKHQTNQSSSEKISSHAFSSNDNDRKQLYSTTYASNDQRSRPTTTESIKLSEASSSETNKTSSDDNNTFESKNVASHMVSTDHESNPKDTNTNRLYPELQRSSPSFDKVTHISWQQDTEIPRFYTRKETESSTQSTVPQSSSYQANDRQPIPINVQKPSSENSTSSFTTTKLQKPVLIYVPDLPTNVENNETLENMIQQCLELKHRQRVLDVKCNTELGIGIISVANDNDKDHMVNTIQKIIIEPSSNTTVSLVNELELISYIVIDTNDMKNLSSSDDISQRWAQLYKTQSKPKCEQLSVQFPNIFRITTYSFDELIQCLSIKTFKIANNLASVYFRADCSFFEELPRTTNIDGLKQAISQQISNKHMFRDLIYIQYNKDGANAVIITTGRARIWSLYKSVQLDGRVIMKKDQLACRLLLPSVPKTIAIELIQNHKIFNNSVIKVVRNNEHVIVELSDRTTYEKCLDQGALRINDHVLAIELYTFSKNLENSEIDAETWYETEMYDYKADITPFMSNLQHPIFRLKWNPTAFLEQFRRWISSDHDKKDKEYEKLCNQQRHLLRMTVMLNTIGVTKRGFYRIGDKEIKIKSDRLQTILYDHKSKLQRGKTVSLTQATEYPYSSTMVKVINDDCLIVYKKLVNEGYRPVILNMANAYTPGGGYKRGDGAQEETLFRRSNYYQSLDLTLDDGKPTARFYCNSNCDLIPLKQGDQLYPMNDYGAIYTSGLTAFRLPEDKGYPFMDIPMCDVCAIAMAAYRNPETDNKNLLAAKYSIGTRKKIENIFAIAYQHKHDSLVLSALGCGAFHNPPSHVATLFKSVIEQYAGYFKCIYFSIIDDHNTGQNFNPHGNFRPFQKVLDDLLIKPQRNTMIDMMIGPWRILNQTTINELILSDIAICYLTPCYYGGKCEHIKNEQHCQEYSHPPLCSNADNNTSCKEKSDDQHMLWFRHRQKCFYGGLCELIDKDLKHSNEFEHPEYCRDGSRCENMEHAHLKSYRHLPLCKYARQCVDYNRKSHDHCQKFRHCIPNCRFNSYCVRYHDGAHFNEKNHPFQKPCPFTPFLCPDYIKLSESKNIKSLPINIQNHCLQFSHVCRFGRHCHDTSDLHWKTTIHIARNMCSGDQKCEKLHSEEHLNSFTHTGIADIRRLCQHAGFECRDKRKIEHIKRYRHHGNYDFSGVISYFGQNKHINFVQNQQNIIKTINNFIRNSKSNQTLSVPTEIQNLIKAFQPIHRCGKVIFESILVHGHVMSREHMEHLKKPRFVAQAVQEHKRIRTILNHYKTPNLEADTKEYIRAIVSDEYQKKSCRSNVMGPYANPQSNLNAYDKYENTIPLTERTLRATLKDNEIAVIRNCTIDIAEASWNLNSNPSGIGYLPDKNLGTDKHVFSILGPHLGHYYGDIYIVFKSEIMLHPDANFSPQAATSFSSGRTFSQRPWTNDPGLGFERVNRFHQSKLHCSVPGYEYAAAAELIAVTGSKNKTMDVTVKDIFKRWKKVDSHEVFEAHLPQLVPLDYIDEIYIPKSLFASLKPPAQKAAKKIFGDSLHITDHQIDPVASTMGGGPSPQDKIRAVYQDYVTDKLIEKFTKRIERTRHLYGTVITLAPSQFQDHIILPLTIHDAYKQYSRIHKNPANSNEIYIYWQAMYGDMMITLADEQINPNRRQSHIQCLVCYIAERPTITTRAVYSESYSYLNAGDPFGHRYIMSNGQCSKGSNKFHCGSNTEDYVTYCLKIDKNTGEVILSHAGSNSIYCYETISCSFPRRTLDLNKLNYVHVSAGSQKVPIRNLIISFDQTKEWHPSFDRNFKEGSDINTQNKKSSSHNNKTSSEIKESSDQKSPSLFRKGVNVVGNLLGFDMAADKKDELAGSSNSSNKKSDNTTHASAVSGNASLHAKENDQKIPCRYASDCHDQKDTQHCSKYSHPGDSKSKSSTVASQGKTVCRHGSNCHDKQNAQHCSKYSHPDEYESRSTIISTQKKISCRYGYDCHDQKDAKHCSKYSHPRDSKSASSTFSMQEETVCRYGPNCRDKQNAQHCSEYSHPADQRKRDEKIPCKFGNLCYNTDPYHRSKYSHPNE